MAENSTKPSPGDPGDPEAAPDATAPSDSTPQQPATEPSGTSATDAEKKWPDESDPLFGHLHHLSEEQDKALNEFRKVCAEKGLYRYAQVSTEAGGDKEEGGAGAEGPKDASHDDATLL